LIQVTKIDKDLFEVCIENASSTSHRVSLTDHYYQQLTNQLIPKKRLIEWAFEFLLKRESNTMILKEFDLPVIQSYFSSFENEMKDRAHGK